MGFDKQGSKGGGRYVGGFLQLFDWKAKSRKKLFSNKSECSDGATHGNISEGYSYSPMSPLNLMDAVSNVRGSSDYSRASSVTDDESYVSKPAGVVARLMGLDSLPTYNFDDPCSSPFLDTQSLRDAHHQRESLKFHQNYQTSHSGNLLNNGDKKMPKRPIEKFQTEMLPPKSAKSIPLTHHKLLSPIKNPNFIPSKNAAHIMEAAARMIDSGPHASAKTKRPLVGSTSSSVPLKVRDLKEKAEATQKVPSRVRDSKERSETSIKPFKLADTYRRPVESNVAKYLKGESVNKSWDGPDTTSFRILPDTGGSSVDFNNNKGKSISLAIQAKVNVQRREGIGLSDSRCLSDKKDQNEVKSSQTNTTQPNSRKSMYKKSPTHNASGVLTQNNQKQNRVVDKKNKLPSKPSISLSQDKKHVSFNSSYGRHNIASGKIGVNSKSGSRKMGSESPCDENEVLSSSAKNLPRKKRIVNREFRFEKNHDVDFELADKYENRNNGSDVVSFTFTAPLTRAMPGSDRAKLSSSSLGFNVIGGDALSKLLEQKLREVTSRVGSSSGNNSSELGSVTTAASILQHLSPTNNQRSSNDAMMLRTKHSIQGIDEMDACSSSHVEDKRLYDCRHPSPLSILEPAFSIESSNSSDSYKSNITEGNKQCSSSIVQAQEEYVGAGSLRKFYSVEADTELSDSAASTSITTVTRKESMKSTSNWEREYVKEILCNLETVFNDFALGRVTETSKPHIFDQLEKGNKSVSTWPKRKVLFDCVGESLDIRCRRYVGGGYKAWAKGAVMVRRKERLAAEVYKEIWSLEKMGECMVDELVDKDMSSQHGKWADFEVEAFQVGIEMEGRILNSLINEMVADVLRGG